MTSAHHRTPPGRLGLPRRGSPPAHEPAATEVALAMLAACHGRVAQHGATLERLARHLEAQGVDAEARDAAAGLLRYFDTSARDHHADEEADLFPALIESMAGSDAVCLRELTAALTDEHRELERRWRALRPALEQAAAGRPARLAAEAVSAFNDLYARHIAREDHELLPMAKRLLDDAELERIGRAMRARRQATAGAATAPDAPSSP